MELEDLLLAWKAQDKYIHQHLRTETFKHLLEQKSQGVLSHIVKRLTLELLIVISLVAGFNLLFFNVNLPYTAIRWICFGAFNIIALSIALKYAQTIIHIQADFKHDIANTLEKIIQYLNRFRMQNKLLHMPVGILCLVMFAGAQNILYWLPWLLIEFFLWRWIFIPKMERRFESYIIDLEYSLKNLREI